MSWEEEELSPEEIERLIARGKELQRTEPERFRQLLLQQLAESQPGNERLRAAALRLFSDRPDPPPED